MSTKIQKWGNSLAIRIPKSYAEALKFDEGSDVKFKIVKGKLIISRKRKQEFRLEDLLDNVAEKNLHKEIVFGKTREKEEKE
ncbi:MAG: AbrB/MazE/SpoVT family DNA-binding domain-containing protein [Ignavibacteriae bacterium]|nr:AbrB/MazE/SpoVT family DNA-binding domain-containing protein [Ignavibacteriota bacterium]